MSNRMYTSESAKHFWIWAEASAVRLYSSCSGVYINFPNAWSFWEKIDSWNFSKFNHLTTIEWDAYQIFFITVLSSFGIWHWHPLTVLFFSILMFWSPTIIMSLDGKTNLQPQCFYFKTTHGDYKIVGLLVQFAQFHIRLLWSCYALQWSDETVQ